MEPDPKLLKRKCNDTGDLAHNALSWIDDAENHDTVGDGRTHLMREFRRFAKTAQVLGRAVDKPMSVGLYGQSQAGKSYLAAQLCQVGSNPPLIEFGPEGTRNYRSEINPGGDRESTGVVTRFSIQPISHPEGYPVAFRLLSECDIIKVLGNSYFKDTDPKTLKPMPTEAIDDTLDRARRAVGPGASPLSEEDIWDVREYFVKQFHHLKPMESLNEDYWREAEELGAKLDLSARASLFAPLWGGHTRLTELYKTLVGALESLGNPSDAYSTLDALIPRKKSIIDVETLLGLGDPNADTLDVHTKSGITRTLPRPVVTALIAELQLQIHGTPHPFFENTDLLDFPGARNRDPVDMGDFLLKKNALKELLVRGKVAYLFDRYVAEQELTSLFLVLKPSNQDITDLPALIAEWIERSHGSLPEERARISTLLFLIFSWFNLHLESKPGEEGDGLAERFRARMNGTIKSFFAKSHDWPTNWDGRGPFRNCFWLRDPIYSDATFDADGNIKEGGVETGVKPEQEDRLCRMRAAYLDLPEVRQQFAEPALAWDEAMRVNDGGVSLLAERLALVSRPEVKLTQIASRISDTRTHMVRALERFFVSDDADKRLKERYAVFNTIAPELEEAVSRRRFSTLIRVLQIEEGHLFEHLRAQARRGALPNRDEPAAPLGGHAPVTNRRRRGRFSFHDMDEDVPAETTTEDVTAESQMPPDRNAMIAEEMISAWVDAIGQRTENERVARDLGVSTTSLSEIAAELTKGARRSSVATDIVKDIMRFSFPENPDRAMYRNAVMGARRISAFAASLDARRNGGALFERPAFVSHALELKLSEEPDLPEDRYIDDWAHALKELVEANAESIDGHEINRAQNTRLGKIIAQLDAKGA